jgi:hypothetical protein
LTQRAVAQTITPMLRALPFALVLAMGCTPIRPLDAADAGGGRPDAFAAGDAFSTSDAFAPDGSTGDVGMADAFVPGPDACATVGTPCDGPDADECAEGVMQCVGGHLSCDDTTGDTLEVCGGAADEDCDGMIDEAGAVGGTTAFVDADRDGFGDDTMPVMVCMVGPGFSFQGGDCDDTNANRRPMIREQCNAMDDDCDGLVDDGNPCNGCTTRTNAGSTYLVCTNGRTWDAARADCMLHGYDLAVVETSAEQMFLSGFGGGGSITGGNWIGLRSDTTGTFTWVDGTAVTFIAWASGEPNLHDSCVRMRTITGGQWADTDCTSSQNDYICELPVP